MDVEVRNKIESLRNEFDALTVPDSGELSTETLDKMNESLGIATVPLNRMPPLNPEQWERLCTSIEKIRSRNFVDSYRKLFPTSDTTDDVRRRIANMSLKEAEQELKMQASVESIRDSAGAVRPASSQLEN